MLHNFQIFLSLFLICYLPKQKNFFLSKKNEYFHECGTKKDKIKFIGFREQRRRKNEKIPKIESRKVKAKQLNQIGLNKPQTS